MKYIHPDDDGNHTGDWILPSNGELLRDYRKAGGDFKALLRQHIEDESQRPVVALAIVEQISSDSHALDQWQHIGVMAEQAAAMHARAELMGMAKTRGPQQIQALKLVREFTKDHVGKVREAIDSHLEELPEDEDEAESQDD